MTKRQTTTNYRKSLQTTANHHKPPEKTQNHHTSPQTTTNHRAAKLSLLNFLSLFRDLQKPTRFTIQWGGVVAECFFRVLWGQTTFSGGGVVTEISRYLQLRNHIFTPYRVIFVGGDTHFWVYTPTNLISC